MRTLINDYASAEKVNKMHMEETCLKL